MRVACLFLAVCISSSTCGLSLVASADETLEQKGQLIFSDDFERSESQEQSDEPGNGWKTNSKSRAKGDKQVDLKDGALHVFISEKADHAVSVTQPIKFTDGAVSIKFKLDDAKDSLNLDFADQDYKPVHAGHLLVVRVKPHQVQIADLKTGIMDLKLREANQSKTLTAEQKEFLKTKTQTTKHSTKLGDWHDLVVAIEGDQVSVKIDGADLAEFSSEGFAHPTKKMLRLGVPRQATVDDVKIYRFK